MKDVSGWKSEMAIFDPSGGRKPICLSAFSRMLPRRGVDGAKGLTRVLMGEYNKYIVNLTNKVVSLP
jgi:hypothetical protein